MTPLLHSVAIWWTTHSNWVNFIYFALAILVALYTERAKRIVTAPLWFPLKRFVFWAKRDLDNQIDVLKYMHTDAFHLVHYLAFYLIHAVKMAFGRSLVLALLMMLTDFKHDPRAIAAIFMTLFVSIFVARLYRLHFTLNLLFDYDKSMAWLEELRGRYA
ncbi:MAG: hypothetical protein V4555_15025 [Acidobacteriota bacterium]